MSSWIKSDPVDFIFLLIHSYKYSLYKEKVTFRRFNKFFLYPFDLPFA